MEIPPSSSLIAALSEFTENRSTAATTAATEARRQEKTRVEAQQAQQAQRADDAAATDQRVQVSSERELEAARDAASQADEQAILRREAPTAGVEERHQPPGQIIDISV